VPDAVFRAEDGSFIASELARGPWDPAAQHGGAPAALLMRALEQLPGGEGLLLSRVTYELLRPVPIGRFQIRAEVVRPGRRVQLLEASLWTDDGVEVVRARALRIRAADAETLTAPDSPPTGPERGRPNDFHPGGARMFANDAIELRFVEGTFREPGPATVWFRLLVQLVAGEAPSPLQSLAAAGDFGNGIASAVPWGAHAFINPDLTLYIERQPVGEWICLEAVTRVPRGGIGVAESVLYDERGRVGRAIQALLVTRPPPPAGSPTSGGRL
jgi:Thioesterase-like superfamily